MIKFVIEALFALVFVQALVAYLRRRDPVQRDVMLVFAAVAMLFVLDVARTVLGEPPALLRAVSLVMFFAQPYFTLRLLQRVRTVPRWLHVAAITGVVVSSAAVLSAPRLSRPAVVGVVGIFVAMQTTAAVLLTREGRLRSGSPRVRLNTAAASTALFGLGLLAASTGSVAAPAREAGQVTGYVVLVVSALGYVVAFLPPTWVRRLWSNAVSYRVTRQMLEAPGEDRPEQTWVRYAQIVREVSGADAVLVVPPDGNGEREVAVAGRLAVGQPAGGGPPVAGDGDVSRLLRVASTADLAGQVDHLPAFATAAGARAGARYLTATPVRSPLGGTGALVLLNRRRGLFSEDDVRLLAELGSQAAIIAERGAVRAEQERLAHELARSIRALSAASQAKSDFLASMSHELRTPLNAIIGFSELMRGEQSVEDARVVPTEWIEHIYSSGRHLLNLINDILDLAKIEAGRLELRPERVDLAALVVDTVSTLGPLLERKRLDLRTEIEPVEVRADRVRMRQVLDNLLSNAIKFTPDGGRITVRAARADAEIHLSVADTGVGIEPADQDRIFEEFQQVGDPSMHQVGTGLGLALTRRLVESHGGTVRLESAPGAGSTFTVCLPDSLGVRPPVLAVEQSVELVPADGATVALPPRGGAGILLIEDEPSAARLLGTYLENAGYRVRVASSGEAGLREARAERPDAVVLDVLLPGIDGWEVLRLLKQDPALRDVPVFVASVVDERDVGMSLGAVDFFVKPIDRQRLLGRIAEFLVRPGDGADQMHVLAVDEDPQTLEIIAEALRQQHVDVVTASTGQEAVRLARTQPFDLIISDLLMPDIDGITLLSALDRDPSTSQIPVLMVTGRDLTQSDRDRVDAKALGILPKGEAVHEALHHWMTHLPRPTAEAVTTTGPEGIS